MRETSFEEATSLAQQYGCRYMEVCIDGLNISELRAILCEGLIDIALRKHKLEN